MALFSVGIVSKISWRSFNQEPCFNLFSISRRRLLLSVAFVSQYFIVTCLTLHLIKSHRRPLSSTSLNSTGQEGRLSFIRLMYYGSSNRLVSFQHY